RPPSTRAISSRSSRSWSTRRARRWPSTGTTRSSRRPRSRATAASSIRTSSLNRRPEGAPMDHVTTAVDPFMFRFSIFVLAVFVGYYVVWSVTPALHTPLMSVTNAISSVIVVGALLAVGVTLVADDSGPIWARALGFVALVLASVNIFGGF